MLKQLLLLILLLPFSLYAKTITIAVAANVSYAIEDLKKEFKKTNPDTNVRVTLGSSGKLTAQIKNGAPYDLFMSANMKYPNALYDDKIAITKPIVYAKGSLALLSSKKKDFSKGLNIILEENIKRIAMANPKTAPYGIATKEVLDKSKLYKNVKSKLIFGESISQTVAYTVSAANIGFIAKSSLYSPKMKRFKENINWVEIDKNLYTPISQGMVILKRAQENLEVKAFYDFMQSSHAKNILKEYGYSVDEWDKNNY